MKDLTRLTYDDMAQEQSIQVLVRAEPEVERILQLASSLHVDVADRWIAYSAFKHLLRPYVGWNARKPELQSSRLYEVAIMAIDYLLPDASDSEQAVALDRSQWIQQFRDVTKQLDCDTSRVEEFLAHYDKAA